MSSELNPLSPYLRRLLKRSQGWSLINFRSIFPERKTTYMNIHVLWDVSEHAFLPENDNPVKHSAVMSSWLPDCLTGDLEFTSYSRDGIGKELCVCVFVSAHVKCVRQTEWRDRNKNRERERLRWLLSLCSGALRQIWCGRSVAQQHTLTYICVCAHKHTPNSYMFIIRRLSAGNKAGWHPAEWSQPMLSPTNQQARQSGSCFAD